MFELLIRLSCMLNNRHADTDKRQKLLDELENYRTDKVSDKDKRTQ